jgi:hypothetical protein
MANEMFSEEYTKEQRINFFDLFEQENNGILLSFEKDMSFNTSIENGITNVELKYALKFKKSTVEVTIVLIDKGKGFKVFSITE